MILQYNSLGPLLLLGRGVGRRVLFHAQQGVSYTVTTENYAKGLMCSPFLAELLGRDLRQIKEYLDGGSKDLIESWVYEDVARCLLHLKESAMKGQVEIKEPVTILINQNEADDSFKRDLERQKNVILKTLAGDLEGAPSEFFSKMIGVFAMSQVRKDPSLLDDQLLSLSFMYMEKGGVVCGH